MHFKPIPKINIYLGVHAGRDLVVVAPALILAVVGPWMDPAWFQNLYLDVVGMELVVVVLFLLAELDQELVEGVPCQDPAWLLIGQGLGLVPCPEVWLICA